MKKYLINFLFLFLYWPVAGQQRIVDSLKKLPPTNNDTLSLVHNRLKSLAYEETNHDSAVAYARKYLNLAEKLNYKLEQAEALREMAYSLQGSASGLNYVYEAQRIIQQDHDEKILPAKYLQMFQIPVTLQSYPKYKQYINGRLLMVIGIQYLANHKNDKAGSYFLQVLNIGESLPSQDLQLLSYLGLSAVTKNYDSSLEYIKKSYIIAQPLQHKELGNIERWLANKYKVREDYQKQLYYLKASIDHEVQQGRLLYSGSAYLALAGYYQKATIKRDSSVFYADKALQIALQANYYPLQYSATKFIFEIYKKEGNKDSAFKYLDLMLAAREKTSNEDEVRKFEIADFNQQQKQVALKTANEKYESRLKIYGLITMLFVFVLLAIIFWNNSKKRKREYIVLQEQKIKTDQALQELKTTQSQLIQSEKMASLGALTAGIAHEIQNPLNFVNNFSEVNAELIEELKVERQKAAGERNGQLEDDLLNDLSNNLEKINHHGKRADAIVKGMLQHSRNNTGTREFTDINALADEYLRLSYHGLRAKDKLFNAIIKTDYDESIGKLNVIPQDIGRVLLNLITNAFYAVDEKKKSSSVKASEDNYEPTITVSTKKINGKVEIKVQDNGNGIPTKVLDKIFQPFFTTKPTGQGTGLGLSLAYDIVKAHGGELKVETLSAEAAAQAGKEAEGTEFIILLPVV